MVFGHIVSSPRGNLSLRQSLGLAHAFLETARNAQDRDIALVLCHETEITLFQAKKSAKRSDDSTVRHGIAIAYIGLGRVLDSHEHRTEAQAIYKKAEKMGVNIQDQGQLQLAQSLAGHMDTIDNTQPANDAVHSTSALHKKRHQGNNIVSIPSHIFSENARPPTIMAKLPEPDERLSSTPQLACCLGLLKESHSLDDILEPAARDWLQVVENDEDEQDRFKVLATDVIRTFKKEEIKDAKAVAEVVTLAPVLDKDAFRDLLLDFYNGIDHSGLLDFYQLDGLAHMIQGADPGFLHADDLVKILGLLATRLRNTHKQSPQHIYQLTLAASYVLDAMADIRVEGLDRETLHQPLLSYLDSLKGCSDPFLMYQVAYAHQALLCVPDNETLWQATLRRTTKVIRGVSGLVSAVKGLDLNGFLDGLEDIQQGLAGASEMARTVVTVFDNVSSLASGSQGFLNGLKEGLSFQRKRAWYPALRGADAFIQDGDFIAFKQLIYRNDKDWGNQPSIKEWILIILTKVASSTGSSSQYHQLKHVTY
ncbi:hypothetical protein B0O80DRAFT_491764 [Mortierella sp. GBAus27b]|nr:hypothetical protein B0O80DRAFT_491764 [Mortierella sp. GBAus27b]